MKAKYTVFIPGGGPVSMAAHQYLMESRLPIDSATVHTGMPFNSLVVFAEESPEMDSTMKQLGTYVGEVANMPVITVAKEGKNVATWQMSNPHYQEPNVEPVGALSDDASGTGPVAPGAPQPGPPGALPSPPVPGA